MIRRQEVHGLGLKLNQGFIFHHIGYATRSIEKTMDCFTIFGYSQHSLPVEDPLQKVKVIFLTHTTMPTIELIEPMTPDSPVSNTLSKVGPAPHHLCFKVRDLIKSMQSLLASGFVLTQAPVPARAFEQRQICFVYHRSLGLVELVEADHV